MCRLQGCSNVFNWEGLSPPKLGSESGPNPRRNPEFWVYFEHVLPFEPLQLFDKATPMVIGYVPTTCCLYVPTTTTTAALCD